MEVFRVWMAALLSVMVFGANAGETRPPTFAEYPVSPDGDHPAVHVELSSAQARRYATELRDAAKGPINFAGHFILATMGCGAGCVVAGAIDVRTGGVTMLPFTVSDWPLSISEPLLFRADSRLLVVEGSRNETGHGTCFYAFDGVRFEWIAASGETK